MSSRWANHGGGRGRYPAWRTVAIAVLSAVVVLQFLARLAWPAAPAAPGELAPQGARARGPRGGGGRGGWGGGGGGGGAAPGAVPGREASGLTVATLVREEHRCTDALHGTLGRLPERMTVRVFDVNSTRPGSSGRWYRSSLPFGRPFALDDTEGALCRTPSSSRRPGAAANCKTPPGSRSPA